MEFETEDILAKKIFKKVEKNKKLILGIDEAGRGPVLGYLIYVGMIYYEDNKNLLIQKFKDSKTLRPEMRKKLMTEIDRAEDIGYVLYGVHPKTISYRMLSQNKNSHNSLNEISMRAIQNIISTVESEFTSFGELSKIYIDALGNTKSTITTQNEWHQKTFNRSVEYIIESKADMKYRIVSGASIVAKVSRDMLLHDYLSNTNYKDVDFNSGYPADPKTRTWLKNNYDHIFGYPDIVRFSWNTVKEIVDSFCEEDNSVFVSGYKSIKY